MKPVKLLATLLFVAAMAGGFAVPSGAVEAPSPAKVRYVPNTTQNISDVLFRKGILKVTDPAAVEEYIRLHECALYEEYGGDDLAWSRIREAYARDLESRLHAFPDGVEIVSAIKVTQYDVTTAEFGLAPEAQMDNMGVITALRSESGSYVACDRDDVSGFVPRVHPLSLTIKLDVPINFKSIPLDEAKAKILIDSINARNPGISPELQQRYATLVMRIRLTNTDPLAGMSTPSTISATGMIDDFRVYESAAQKELLFRVDYQTQREEAEKK